MDKILGKHTFEIGEHTNGGESLNLRTTIHSNGDPDDEYMTQELTLHSYGNSASFNLCSNLFTPEVLRKLANELESALNMAKAARKYNFNAAHGVVTAEVGM